MFCLVKSEEIKHQPEEKLLEKLLKKKKRERERESQELSPFLLARMRWLDDHQLNGREFEQTPGDSGQGNPACCSPRGHRESDMTERLNNGSNSATKQ